MNVSKQQIINGVTRYVKNEIINKVTDKPLKIIIATAVSMLEAKSEIIDSVFDNPIVSSILNETNGSYDINAIGDALEKAMKEYGDFPIEIPAIKFISPQEKQLTFTAADIAKLKECIVGGVS